MFDEMNKMKKVVIAIATLVMMSVGAEAVESPTEGGTAGNEFGVVSVVTRNGKSVVKIANMTGGEKPVIRKKTKASSDKIKAKKKNLKKQKSKNGGEKVRPEGATTQKSGVVPKQA